MTSNEIKDFKFCGKPHFPNEMDPDGSFQSVWTSFYQSDEYRELANKYSLQLMGITQFGSENFIYWVGAKVTDEKIVFPKSWMSFDLPGGSGFWVEKHNLQFRSLPLEFSLRLVYNAAEKEHFKLPINISHTDKPYFVEEIDSDVHRYFIYDGIEEEIFED